MNTKQNLTFIAYYILYLSFAVYTTPQLQRRGESSAAKQRRVLPYHHVQGPGLPRDPHWWSSLDIS